MCQAFVEKLLTTGLWVGDTMGVAGYRAQGRDGPEEASFPAQELGLHGAHWSHTVHTGSAYTEGLSLCG